MQADFVLQSLRGAVSDAGRAGQHTSSETASQARISTTGSKPKRRSAAPLGSSWTTIRPQKSPISCTSGIWLVHSGIPEESFCWLRTPVQAERINLKPRDVIALTNAHEDHIDSRSPYFRNNLSSAGADHQRKPACIKEKHIHVN